jgi:hypothetical protein
MNKNSMRRHDNFWRKETWGAEFVQVLLPLNQNYTSLILFLLFSVNLA